MGTLLGLAFVFCVFVLPAMLTDHKFNTRISPDGYKTDWSAMNRDLAMSKSKTEVKQKFNRGGYDILDKK